MNKSSGEPINETPILETRGLEKRFGGVRALVGVDFQLFRGDLRCLIGPNGAGKSTFFKMLTAQLRPSAGRILFEGVDITGKQPHQISRLGIGIKNQVPTVFDGLSVHEGLYLAASAGNGVAEARAIVTEVLERLELAPFSGTIVGLLAHGQRQWVEFGMVMARRPKLILLDEPTAGMAEAELGRAVRLIREMNRTATLIVVEHDMQFIREIAGLVTVFHQGAILMEDTMQNVQRDRTVRDIYLG